MAFFFHSLIVLLVLLCATRAHVFKFSAANIDSFYGTNDIVVVQFCAPCKYITNFLS